MKFQVAKSDLMFALNTVSPAKGSTEGDINSHFLFRFVPGTTDKLQVLAGASRLYAHCDIPKVVVKEGEEKEMFTVEGWRLLGWLGLLGDVALDFETLPNAEVLIKAGKGRQQRFRSLDHALFPFSDLMIKNAQSLGKLSAKRLSTALTISRLFASKNESEKADVVVVDILKGIVRATDKRGVMTFLKLHNADEIKFRVHYKEINAITNFLGQVGDEDIEIFDEPRAGFIKRLSDDAIMGETRFQTKFPNMPNPDDKDQRVWEVKVSDLREAAMHGFFSAQKGDDRLFFQIIDNDTLKVSMLTETNTGGAEAMTIPVKVTTNDPAAPALPPEGIAISQPHIIALCDFTTDETIRLGVNTLTRADGKTQRYVRVEIKMFVDEKTGDHDKYVFVLVGLAWI